MRTTYWFLLLGLMLLTVCLALLIPLFTDRNEPSSTNTRFVQGDVYEETPYDLLPHRPAWACGRECAA